MHQSYEKKNKHRQSWMPNPWMPNPWNLTLTESRKPPKLAPSFLRLQPSFVSTLRTFSRFGETPGCWFHRVPMVEIWDIQSSAENVWLGLCFLDRCSRKIASSIVVSTASHYPWLAAYCYSSMFDMFLEDLLFFFRKTFRMGSPET